MKSKFFIALFYSLISILLGAMIFGTFFELDPLLSIGVSVIVSVTFLVVKQYTGLEFNIATVVCGEINASIANNCDFPMQAGTRERAIIINFKDWQEAVITTAIDNYTIESITLDIAATAFFIDGKSNSIKPKYTMLKQGPNKMFDHMIDMLGFTIDPDTKNELNAGIDGRYVIITENFFKGPAGNSAFEVYGSSTGLEMTALERDPLNQDTQGAFAFTFGTDLNKEPKMPAPLFITSYAATKAVFDGLL